jgi:hypothetical protein
LIRYLSEACGGNPHDKRLICVTGTAYSDGLADQPRNAADRQTDSYFFSGSGTGQWLCYDFKDMRVAVTDYVLRSSANPIGWRHLRSWVIEGSDDSANWVELDRRQDEGTLNGPRSISSFEVRNVTECRYIRLRGIGPSWKGDNHLLFSAFDLFGGLRVPDSGQLM